MSSIIASVVVGADSHLIDDCVASLLASGNGHDIEVRVVANDPEAAIAARLVALSDRFPNVRVHINQHPLGFATNHNRALHDAEADYYLVANDDLVFRDGAVARCIDFLDQPENVGVAALSPRLLNSDGSLQRSTYAFPTVSRALLDLSGFRSWIPHNRATDWIAGKVGRGSGRSRFWAHDCTRDVDTFRGAAMCARRTAWIDVGPFCEVAWVGGEIAEWHRRCRDAGWRVVFYPKAEVIHFGSRTVGRNRLLKSEYLKGYLLYFSRHSQRSALLLFRACGTAVAMTRLALCVVVGDRTGVRLWRRNVGLLTRADWSEG